MIELADLHIAIRHILYEDGKMTQEGSAFFEHEQLNIRIFGHAHQPKPERFGKTLLFNPGSAGLKRFKLLQGIGLLHLCDADVKPHLISLPDKARLT